MHADGGHIGPQQPRQQTALEGIVPYRLYLGPFAVHNGMVGNDQLTARRDGLLRHRVGDVQRHHAAVDILPGIPQQMPHVIPLHRPLPGRQLKKSRLNFTNRWHAATPLSWTAAR